MTIKRGRGNLDHLIAPSGLVPFRSGTVNIGGVVGMPRKQQFYASPLSDGSKE